jgi:hypothetical protein
MDPEILQAGVPGAAFQHDQGDHAPDDDVGECRRQLLGHRGTAVGLLGGDTEHDLQPVGGQRLGERPPASTGEIAHDCNAVDAGTLGVKGTQPRARLVQWQCATDRHARDERVVDENRHGHPPRSDR